MDLSEGIVIDPFDIPEEVTETPTIQFNKVDFCKDCGVDMVIDSTETGYICPKCGKLEEAIIGKTSTSKEEGYTTSSSANATLRLVGKNLGGAGRNFVSATASYPITQKRNTENEILNCMKKFNGPKVPEDVLRKAADMYYTNVQMRKIIKRGDVRRGTMAACVYRACKEAGITRKPKEIANIFQIPSTELSNGIKILSELETRGYMPRFIPHDESGAFVDRYFEGLGIDTKYREFVLRLIRFTNKKRIAEHSIISSKCAGAIYVLIRQLSLKITPADIAKECDVAETTFKRFSQEIYYILSMDRTDKKYIRYRQLRHLFKKHGIPYEVV